MEGQRFANPKKYTQTSWDILKDQHGIQELKEYESTYQLEQQAAVLRLFGQTV